MFFLKYYKHSVGANCLEDSDFIYTNIRKTTPPTNNSLLFLEKSTCSDNLKIDTQNYRDLDITSRNALTYISGNFIQKCLEKHTCEVCIDFVNSQKHIDESMLFTYFKAYQNEYSSNYGNLNVPLDSCSIISATVYDTMIYRDINELDDIFINNFPKLAIENKIDRKLKNLIDNVLFNHSCPNFNFDFLKNLFVRT